MKLLKQISKLVFLFSMLGLLQNCSSPEDEVLEPTPEVNVISSATTSRAPVTSPDQWLIRFYWPSQLTEEQRQWTRDYYLYNQNDYVYFRAFSGSRMENWVVSEHLTHFYAVLCDGCPPTLINPTFRIQVEAIETF